MSTTATTTAVIAPAASQHCKYCGNILKLDEQKKVVQDAKADLNDVIARHDLERIAGRFDTVGYLEMSISCRQSDVDDAHAQLNEMKAGYCSQNHAIAHDRSSPVGVCMFGDACFYKNVARDAPRFSTNYCSLECWSACKWCLKVKCICPKQCVTCARALTRATDGKYAFCSRHRCSRCHNPIIVATADDHQQPPPSKESVDAITVNTDDDDDKVVSAPECDSCQIVQTRKRRYSELIKTEYEPKFVPEIVRDVRRKISLYLEEHQFAEAEEHHFYEHFDRTLTDALIDSIHSELEDE